MGTSNRFRGSSLVINSLLRLWRVAIAYKERYNDISPLFYRHIV